MPYLMICFNDTLTNDIVSFEQLGPGFEYDRKKITHTPAVTSY